MAGEKDKEKKKEVNRLSKLIRKEMIKDEQEYYRRRMTVSDDSKSA